ncbi:Alanine racemase [Candidatus Magnetomoraceae bacterium gMMP-1]
MFDKFLELTESLSTPSLIIEEKILRKNIKAIHDYAKQHGFAVRPHIKTHKSLSIAYLQMRAGAVGIAAAKVGEAMVMARLKSYIDDIDKLDITIAYPVVGELRCEYLAIEAINFKLRVAADSEYLIDQLGEQPYLTAPIGILIMFDAGLHRCGLSDPKKIIRLAKYVKDHERLRYDGIQMYIGQLYGDAARDPQSFKKINQLWEPVYDALCAAGLKPEMVSSGSTPSLKNTHLISYVNEIRVGTAVLNDYFVLKFGHCTLEDCAARVITTVVSDAVPGQVIIDAGSKALSAKQLLRNENLEMGYIPEYPDAKIFRLHEEHGWVDISQCKNPPSIGDRMSIVPVNVALCMNLQKNFYMLTEEGDLEKKKVDAMGYYV